VTDWATLSEFGTAFGTLVLAVATFASVRSANRAARAAESALLEGLRPILVGSRFQDPAEKVRFMDDEWIRIPGGCGVVERRNGSIYLGLSLRNVGAGLAVLHAWDLRPELMHNSREHRRPDEFRRLVRDLYIAPGDSGFWQGALRDQDEALHRELVAVIERREGFTIDLMYGDVEGGQRVVSRFALTPHDDEDGSLRWLISVSKHWNLDRADPR
jgi:hypothetical protein